MKKITFCLSIAAMAMFTGCCAGVEDTSPVVTQTFSNVWKFHAGTGVDSAWQTTAYNDTAWADAVTNELLIGNNLKTENNFGWYRKTITLSDSLWKAAHNKGGVMLHLGRLAAADEVFLNGELVGKTGEFPHNYKGYIDSERNYFVPDKLLRQGNNLIAVKFFDGWSTGGFFKDAQLSISTAETNDKLTLNVRVLDRDYVYLSDELRLVIVLANVSNKNAWQVDGSLILTVTTDDYQFVQSDTVFVKIKAYANESKYVTSSLNNPVPGFYRYTAQFVRNGKVVFEKKLNVGYDPEKIVSPIDAKPDFKAFWDNNLQELAKVAPQYKLTKQEQYSNADYNVYLVEMRSFGNEKIQGYYAQPTRAGKYPVIIEYMGYGSKPYPPHTWWNGFAYFVLSIRGQGLNEPANHFGKWITYGLDSKEKYYYRGAFLDVVRAIDFVCSRPEIDADKIAVRGGSQGGALSFAAAALDKRVKAAAPSIPFLSDYRDYFKIVHWPRSDFDEYMKNHPAAKWDDVYDLLTYFDIKNLAQWITCPVIMGFGVQDEVCPPHINFAAYNQVKSEKIWMAGAEFGHSTGKEYYDAAMEFFKEKLGVE
ncbi:hypothetical protein FACS189452_03800 [Bacteroidia bacterium]|nr:hypothetical protein FACS189452_03800 [Bacteroidia bacterium]GHT81608.1 hypothetical protein FACS189467_5980 [Bacteroidia bacterium]